MKKLLFSFITSLMLLIGILTPSASAAWFQQDSDITRADISVMLAKNLPDLNLDVLYQSEGCAPDVVGNYAENFICYMIDRGLISPHSDGNFRPNNTVTRAEGARLITNAFDLYTSYDLRPLYSDIEEDAWYKESVNSLAVYGIPAPELQIGDQFHPAEVLKYSIAKAWVKRASSNPEEQNILFPSLSFTKVNEYSGNIINGARNVKIFTLKMNATNADEIVNSLKFRVDGLTSPEVLSASLQYDGRVVFDPSADVNGELNFDNIDLEIDQDDSETVTLYIDVNHNLANTGDLISVVLNGYEVETTDGNTVLVDSSNFPLRSMFSEIIEHGTVNAIQSDNQAESRTVAAGEENVELLNFDLTAFDEDMRLRKLKLNISGESFYTAINSVDLVDENGNLLETQVLANDSGNLEFELNNGATLLTKGQSQTFTIRVDLNLNEFMPAGATIRANILENTDLEFIGQGSGSVINADLGEYPISGETVTVASNASVSLVRTPGVSWRYNVSAGGQVAKILDINITADNADLTLTDLTFDMGQLRANNLILKNAATGEVIASGLADNNGIMHYRLNGAFVIEAGQTITLQLEAEIDQSARRGWHYVSVVNTDTSFIAADGGIVTPADDNPLVGGWVYVN